MTGCVTWMPGPACNITSGAQLPVLVQLSLSSHLSKLLNTKRKDAGVSCLPALSETLQHQQVISVRIENAQINTSMTYN